MLKKIGFVANNDDNDVTAVETTTSKDIYTNTPRKSVVRVYFPVRNASFSYYNDKFDLHIGDMVYVEGKLEGLRGRVTEIEYNFKIKISDYKKVIALVDTSVKGDIYFADSNLIAFDKGVIPFEKVSGWFTAPVEDDNFEISTDGVSFSLDEISGMNIKKDIADRGYEYYLEDRVLFVEIDNGKGKAIVEGSNDNYTVEFEHKNRNIKNLVCNCYCVGACKHEFAVMLQLNDALRIAQEDYGKSDNYIAIINKQAFLGIAVNGKSHGKISFE